MMENVILYFEGTGKVYFYGYFISVPQMEHFSTVCSLFAKSRNNLGALVNKRFIKCHQKSEYLSTNDRKLYHTDAWNTAMNFMKSIENPPSTIAGRTNNLKFKKKNETNVF